MILRTAMLSVMVICTTSLAMAEEVLYCVETDVAGFAWDNQGHVTHRTFDPARFTIKITSETERIITQTTGDTAGSSNQYECKPVFPIRIKSHVETSLAALNRGALIATQPSSERF